VHLLDLPPRHVLLHRQLLQPVRGQVLASLAHFFFIFVDRLFAAFVEIVVKWPGHVEVVPVDALVSEFMFKIDFVAFGDENAPILFVDRQDAGGVDQSAVGQVFGLHPTGLAVHFVQVAGVLVCGEVLLDAELLLLGGLEQVLQTVDLGGVNLVFHCERADQVLVGDVDVVFVF